MPNGTVQSIHTAIKNKYANIESAFLDTKIKARLQRWQKMAVLKNRPTEPPEVESMIRDGDIFLVTVSGTKLVPAIIQTLNNTYKNGLRPRGRLKLKELETVGLETMKRTDTGRWVHDQYFLCRDPQRLIHQIQTGPQSCMVNKNAYTHHISLSLSEKQEQVRQSHLGMLSELHQTAMAK